ncbi:MAG: hypothetical protein H6644_17320 [Caldilineaceae bacterium]|nr:hypothetical protein [Caldilineaceae bacterium]
MLELGRGNRAGIYLISSTPSPHRLCPDFCAMKSRTAGLAVTW